VTEKPQIAKLTRVLAQRCGTSDLPNAGTFDNSVSVLQRAVHGFTNALPALRAAKPFSKRDCSGGTERAERTPKSVCAGVCPYFSQRVRRSSPGIRGRRYRGGKGRGFHRFQRARKASQERRTGLLDILSAGASGDTDSERRQMGRSARCRRTCIFPNYKDQVRFGALSLDGLGVANYGTCSIILKNAMVTHRTSLFESNNVVFTVYKQKTSMADAEKLENGFRAVWEDRHKLCIAKLAPRLHRHLGRADFAGLLLEQGATTMDDKFVEAHVWGPLTVRSIECVIIRRRGRQPRRTPIKDVRLVLASYNITVIEL